MIGWGAMNESAEISFAATCARCGGMPTQTWDRDELLAALGQGEVRYFCAVCGISWDATLEERANIHQHFFTS